MQNPRSLSDLLSGPGNRLNALKNRSAERSRVVDQVRAALPARLAEAVVSAGVDQGRLTVGVVGAVWASRLRYTTDVLRKRLGETLGIAIVTVKIKIVPPAA
jgi:hypothetical protein